MRIIVLIEPVAHPDQVRIDYREGRADASGAAWIIRPDARSALETALQLREATGGEVVALAAGPAQAESALRDALARGADHATLCADPASTDWDGTALAAVLSRAVERLGPFDLIVARAGGEIGPRLAEALGLPQVTMAWDVRVEDGTLRGVRGPAGSQVEVEARLPLLLTVHPEAKTLRHGSAPGVAVAYHDKQVATWTPEELGLDAVTPALKVQRRFAPERAVKGERVVGSPEDVARQLVRRLRTDGLIE